MSFCASLNYLAGLVAGDGSITRPRRARIFDHSREFLEDICRKIVAEYGLRCSVYWEDSTWCLSTYSRSLVSELEKRLISLKTNLNG